MSTIPDEKYSPNTLVVDFEWNQCVCVFRHLPHEHPSNFFVFVQCGMAENGTSSTISVVSSSDPPWDATGEFTYTQTVGPGCLELNYCSEQGVYVGCLLLAANWVKPERARNLCRSRVTRPWRFLSPDVGASPTCRTFPPPPGECDYCLQRCNCPEGFGSLSELEVSTDIARDCSQLTCPSGVSWTPVLSG